MSSAEVMNEPTRNKCPVFFNSWDSKQVLLGCVNSRTYYWHCY